MNTDPVKSRFNLVGVYASALNPSLAKKTKKEDEIKEPGDKVQINTGLFKAVVKKTKKKESLKEAAYSESLRHDQLRLRDGFDASRDITGVYSKEGRPEEPYKFRVDLTNLRPGAEHGNLDVYTLLSVGNQPGKNELPDNIPGYTEQSWNLALGTYDNEHFKAVDSKGQQLPHAISGVKFDSIYNGVEFNVNKQVLRDMGWKDGEPLKLQTFTAKDRHPQVTDSMDEHKLKPWDQEGKLTRVVSTDSPDYIPSRDNNWSDDIVYFILTDRFEDGDKTNNAEVVKDNLVKYQGGDLQGIINKLDYLEDRKISSIWISPTMKNQTEFIDSAGYHGYWPVDFFEMEPHQGDMNKFEELIAKAHEKNMKVILDIPLNHTAWEHPFVKDPEKHDWYHHIGDIVDWNDPYQIENGSMYGLPDLAQENPEVYNYLLDAANFWAKKGVDGYRLDAMMHINKDFWRKFSDDIRKEHGPDFMLVGEVFHGDPNKVASYQTDGTTSLFDLPLYFSIRDVLAHDGSMKMLADKVEETNSKYENPNEMMAMLDNHDTNRFITLAGHNGKDKLKLGLAFLMGINRIPCVYYGTEQAMEGREEHMGKNPPENRAMMDFSKDPEMKAYFDKLAHARTDSPALRSGALKEMWKDDKIYAFARMDREEEAFVVLNNAYNDEYREIPLRAESIVREGESFKDVVTGQKFSIQEGKLKVKLSGKQGMILVPDK